MDQNPRRKVKTRINEDYAYLIDSTGYQGLLYMWCVETPKPYNQNHKNK
jgi:hypothetical protein